MTGIIKDKKAFLKSVNISAPVAQLADMKR